MARSLHLIPYGETMNSEQILIGAAIGTAIGDSLGLPREGLSPSRSQKLYGAQIEHRFLFGRGVVSDDTEHTLLVLQALALHGANADDFGIDLSRRLRWWLASLPTGIGFGTLRALTKSWFGFGPKRSGVQSAGNGPAMRSAVIGIYCATNGIEPDDLCEASTLITHTDQRAVEGALAVAKCAQIAATANNISSEAVVKMLIETCRHSAWNSTLEPMLKSLKSNVSTQEFASNIGLQNGVTGYIVHSVPVAIYAWLRHPENARQALTEIISAGGDSDSTAAVTAALVGCRVGEENFPSQWRTGIADWPLTCLLYTSDAADE